MDYIIGIDIGTSGTKTVLFDIAGNIISSAMLEYPLDQPHNGWAEQNPEDWFKATLETLKKVIKGIQTKNIKGIGLSGQMHGLVMLDELGEIIRPAILWCDTRTTEECKEITEIIGAQRLIEITANPALEGFTASKIMWVKKHEKENYEKCKHILLPKDYVRYKLTGEFATDVSDASGMQLLDIKNRCWSDEILEELNIDKELLAKVYESPEVTGKITKKIADLTGLMEGTIVVAGAGDNAAAAVGTGVIEDGKAFTTIGTSGVVFAHTSELVIDKMGRVHTFCCAVPNAWHVMGVTQAAGLSLKWFRDNFCKQEMEQGKKLGIDPYYLMDQKAESSTIGANKLLYLPYLMGERTPHLDANARGVFFGLSAIHTKDDMIRAVMEGVAFSLKDCVDIISEMNVNISDMVACGGGGSSALWRGMLADLYKCNIKMLDSKEGAALGAALLAGVGAKVYSSVEDACQTVIKIKKCQMSLKENSLQYEKFHKVYKRLYATLKDSYELLANI